MLRNEKFIGNNGKISKGIRLESFIYKNDTSYFVNLSASGLTNSDPLSVYIYSDKSYSFTTRTSDFINNGFSLSDSTTNNKYFLTYGNNDAVTRISSFTNVNGDLKGLLNNYINLEEIEFSNVLFPVNLTDFQWPRNLKTIRLFNSPNITGDFGTFINLDNLQELYILNINFSGEISKYINLNYLSISNQSYPNSIVSDVFKWSFVSNLTYLSLVYINGVYGDLSNWLFNDNLVTFQLNIFSNRNIYGDISDWDISNTKISTFNISYHTTTSNKVVGDMSYWELPSTLINMYLQNLNITSIPTDYSNTNLNTLYIINCPDLSSSLNDITLRNGMTQLYMMSSPLLEGNLNTYTFPSTLQLLNFTNNSKIIGDVISLDYLTNITNFTFNNLSSLSGNISGVTFWTGLTTYVLQGCTGVTGTFTSTTIPNSLITLNLNNTKIILDLNSSFDFNLIQVLNLQNISGITGSFSNMVIDNVQTLDLGQNSFDNDLSELNINWNKIISLYFNNNNNYSDISNWFPSGSTTAYSWIRIDNTNITGNVSNWYFSDFQNFSYLYLNNTNLYGDLSNNNTVLPYLVLISYTDISGDVGKFDYINRNNQILWASNTGLYGNLSGVTLNFGFNSFDVNSCTGITNIEYFMNYLFINRKNWTNNFTVDIRNVGETISGTYELGDLGTYGGHEWDLTEAQINNLVNGIDYDGNGTNTPWTTLQKYYYQKEARVSSSSTQAEYRISIIYYTSS